ncbi:disease resistance protein RPM1-like [Hevea brasiliensis]|uniref:disease resistance protein RPM1-like n=1 Tax=Hevea brasiliensis TaxID=3981 RepID=UPI0025E7099A|nr:disease resistance protein RPM1-like [Hevea brasiliensis]
MEDNWVRHFHPSGEYVVKSGCKAAFKLTYLSDDAMLHWSRLKEDPLSRIAALPNLRKVILVNSFVEENLHFCSGFAKLKILWLIDFPRLTGITIKKGVMTDIQELWIDSCLMLNAVPYGIESLTNLQSLVLTNCSSSLVGRVNDVESKDRSKVLHIPNIKCFKRRAKLSYRFSPQVKKE